MGLRSRSRNPNRRPARHAARNLSQYEASSERCARLTLASRAAASQGVRAAPPVTSRPATGITCLSHEEPVVMRQPTAPAVATPPSIVEAASPAGLTEGPVAKDNAPLDLARGAAPVGDLARPSTQASLNLNFALRSRAVSLLFSRWIHSASAGRPTRFIASSCVSWGPSCHCRKAFVVAVSGASRRALSMNSASRSWPKTAPGSWSYGASNSCSTRRRLTVKR
jgi:hypothetical protein